VSDYLFTQENVKQQLVVALQLGPTVHGMGLDCCPNWNV